MKYIEEFYLFVKVVQEGGFSHAAAALGHADRHHQSTYLPTGRAARMQPAAQIHLQAASHGRRAALLRAPLYPLAEIEQATGEIRGEETDISGLIRLAAPSPSPTPSWSTCWWTSACAIPGYSSTSASPTIMPSRRIRTGTWSFQRRAPQTLPNAPLSGSHPVRSASPLSGEDGCALPPTQLEEHDLIYCWPHQHWQLSGRDEQTICIKRTPAFASDQTRPPYGQPSATSASSTPAALCAPLPARWSARPRPAGLAVGKTSLLHAPLLAPVHPVAC